MTARVIPHTGLRMTGRRWQLAAVDRLEDRLAGYHAARADLLRLLGRH